MRNLIEQRLDWQRWANLILTNGISIDRPRGSRHPDHPSIIYPIDYGFIAGTVSTDGHEIDVFRGTASTGLVGTIISTDHRKADTEFKLMYNCDAAEIYLVNGFINFDRRLMEGELVLRWTMEDIWRMARGGGTRTDQ
jgi:inorganic pyrophosphatase